VKKNKKVFVFAFDGLPLNLARKLADDGVMPNLAKLFQTSCWGNLESSFPPLTAPAWVSFATGKNPGKHGIFNFLQPQDDLNNLEVISSRDIRGKTFYEILEEKGKKEIFINLPCSYPSRIKKGILISSFLAGEDFYYPKDLINQLPEIADYKLAPGFVVGLNIPRGLKEVLAIEENRFACGQKLFQREWDIFFYLVSGTDWAMHSAFDELIEGRKVDPQVRKIFKNADAYLGWFLDNLPKTTAVFVISDHGFLTFSKVFYINAWLKKKKLLDFKLSWNQTRARSLTEFLIMKIKPESFEEKALKKIAFIFINNPLFYSLLVRLIRMIDFFLPNLVPRHFLTLGLEINPEKTKAYALPVGGGCFELFINDKKRFKQGKVSEREYHRLRQKIYQELSKILGQDNVWFREEVYQGQAAKKGADILCSPKDIFVSPAFSNRVFAKKKVNHHSRQGFFVVPDKKAKKGKKVKDLKIIDLAPTILYLLGVRPPADMEGKVLKVPK